MADDNAASPGDSPKLEDSVEIDAEVKEEQENGDDAPNEPDVAAQSGDKVTNQQYKALKEITEVLTNHRITRRGDENYYPSILFRRIPNKRNLPDYHEVIKEPAAISTLKGKCQRKEYNNMKEPVRDFALIVYNAQVYNRPNSAPVRDVFELKAVFEEELQKMVERGLIAAEDAVFPDLGDIPYATPEPDQVSEEEEDVDEDEDDEDEEGDESDEEKGKRARRRGPRGSLAGKKRDRSEDGQKGNDERKKRGRPPRVDTPMEARIKAVLKGIRKPKDTEGFLKVRHFERLPDKAQNLDYFQTIKEPIAVDLIKKKSKRKKYQTLDHLMKDLDLMFRNAMEYNLDDSDIHKDAVDLQSEAHKLADAERRKPDSEYMDEDGRIPLPDGILYGSEIYKVGNWIHIQNPNDVTKPIVAQIYRTWQDTDGQKWINACWYYRPDQTVHQFEKHFYPNEVVKTGQYRDHQVEEIIDRCFVMFFTRYSRGRPRHFDLNKEVYVCEARYNEEKHKLNKIKTWASCLPDEVRDQDYEMDLFDQPRKVKKVPSPLLHLLRDDQKDGDDPPEPEFKHPNAPPVVGAIYRGARDENQSPPPEPTPPPPPTPPPQPVRTTIHNMIPRPQSRMSLDQQGDTNMAHSQQIHRPSPSVPPNIPQAYHQTSASPIPTYARRDSSYQASTPNPYSATPAAPPQTPSQPHATPYPAQQPQHATSLSAVHPVHYAGATPSQNYNRVTAPPTPAPASQYTAYPAAVPAAHGPRPVEVYVMSESANNMIPAEIRQQFPQDEQGRVLFFTTPPVDTHHVVQGRTVAEKGDYLSHSLRYLAVKADREREREQAARKRGLDVAKTNQDASESNKRAKPGFFAGDGEERDADGRIRANPEKAEEIAAEQGQQLEQLKTRALTTLVHQMNQSNDEFYRTQYGELAEQYKTIDATQQKERARESKMEAMQGHEVLKNIYTASDIVVDFKRDPWKGVYKDDFDARY